MPAAAADVPDPDDDFVEEPVHLSSDASDVKDAIATLSSSLSGWATPSATLDFDGTKWTPHLVASKPDRVLHVHLSDAMPRHVVRRLKAAALSRTVYVALTIEALYDEAVLRVLSEIDAEVIVLSDKDGGPTACYFLSALADHGVPVTVELRRELARSSWEQRTAGSNFQKGQHFEGLLAFLLSQVRDFKIFDRNFRGETDEIDIVVQLDRLSSSSWSESGVPFVIVEAKNWKDPAGAPVVTSLIRKLETRRGRARIGLAVATSGFTSDARDEELKEAKGTLCVAMLGPDELLEWIDSDEPDAFLDRHVAKAMLR